jgi:hypothetical protein
MPQLVNTSYKIYFYTEFFTKSNKLSLIEHLMANRNDKICINKLIKIKK